MRPATQKALGWIGLAIGGGGALLVIWSIAVDGWLSEKECSAILTCLSGMALQALVCLWLLKRAYRMEPSPGSVQLVLVDLIAALVIFGSVLYVGSYAEEGAELLRHWLMPSLIIAFSYLAGVTRAARLGLRGWPRYMVGTATAFTIIGCLGLGALVLHLAVLARLADRDLCHELMLDILGMTYRCFQGWQIYTYRVTLCALLMGLWLGLVLRLTMRPGNGPASGVIGKPDEIP